MGKTRDPFKKITDPKGTFHAKMSTIVLQFKHSLALPFFGIGKETDHFQSGGHC